MDVGEPVAQTLDHAGNLLGRHLLDQVGGRLAGRILAGMERALLRKATGYSRYGSDTHKQVYIYGGLDRGPTTLRRDFGMSWGIGGWLLTPFLAKVGPEAADRLRQRVADEITTRRSGRRPNSLFR